MLPYINIFNLALPLPALILLIGLWIGMSISERYADRSHITSSHLYNLTFYGLIIGVIGARLTYVAQFPSTFYDNPSSLISPNPDLLDPLGGLAVGLISALIYIQRNHLSLWLIMDALTPALAIINISLALSNFASGNGYGSPTTLPWGIDLWGAVRHPSQIYEALGAGIVLWSLWPRRTVRKSLPGTLFLRFIAYSATMRLFLEAFRSDSLVIIHNFRVVQIVAWIVLAISLWGWYHLLQGQRKTRENIVK